MDYLWLDIVHMSFNCLVPTDNNYYSSLRATGIPNITLAAMYSNVISVPLLFALTTHTFVLNLFTLQQFAHTTTGLRQKIAILKTYRRHLLG